MPTLAPNVLTYFVSRIFQAAETPKAHADLVADSLVQANLAGHDSHGVMRAVQYVRAIEVGNIKPAASPLIAEETDTVARIDGQFGFGQVIARFGISTAIEKAKQHGLAATSLFNCNHVGRLGEWVEMAAAENLIGLAFCNVVTPNRLVAPHNGKAGLLGTNPFAAAIPMAGGGPFVLDFATSVVAEGKVRLKRNQKADTPEGWIINAQGEPTIDAEDLYHGGAILPLGGHKGYGLGLLVEILGGILTGRGTVGLEEIVSGNGVLFIVLDIATFRPLEAFLADTAILRREIKATPATAGADEVLLAGEPERLTAASRRANGIPIDDGTWSQLVEIATGLGVGLPV